MSYESVIDRYYDRVGKLKVKDPNNSKVNQEALYGILDVVPEMVRNYHELLLVDKAMDILSRSYKEIGDQYEIVALEMHDATALLKEKKLNRRYRGMIALSLKKRLEELSFKEDLAHITNIYLDAPSDNVLGYDPIKVNQFIDELIDMSTMLEGTYED